MAAIRLSSASSERRFESAPNGSGNGRRGEPHQAREIALRAAAHRPAPGAGSCTARRTRARRLRRRAWSGHRRRSGRGGSSSVSGWSGVRRRSARRIEETNTKRAHARRRGRARKRGGRQMVHAVVGRVRNIRPDMRDAGEMHDRIHAGERAAPSRPRRARSGSSATSTPAGNAAPPAVAHRGAHRMAGIRERSRQRRGR